ncbi:MAG: hypothetical protein ACLFWL_02945 [Candidatus Brocadiia bacterium]
MPAVPLINQLEAGSFRFAPEIREKFGALPDLNLPQMYLRYEFEFLNRFDGRVELVMEPDSIQGEWEICLNDSASLSAEEFKRTDSHVRGSLGADITDHLKTGSNLLCVNSKTDRFEEGLRNPLYLAGDFGVEADPPALIPPRRKGQFECYTDNGLPYYSGILDYQKVSNIGEIPEASELLLKFEFQTPFHQAAMVRFNDGEYHELLWEPRRCLVPAGELQEGENLMQLRVYTTLIRSFEGEFFDEENHENRPVC